MPSDADERDGLSDTATTMSARPAFGVGADEAADVEAPTTDGGFLGEVAEAVGDIWNDSGDDG